MDAGPGMPELDRWHTMRVADLRRFLRQPGYNFTDAGLKNKPKAIFSFHLYGERDAESIVVMPRAKLVEIVKAFKPDDTLRCYLSKSGDVTVSARLAGTST